MPRASKIAAGVAAGVVIVVVAAGGAQLWAQHTARLRVEASLASLPAGTSGRHGAVAYNLFTGTLRVDDLVITQNGQPVFSIGRSVLHHVTGAGTPDAPYHVKKLRLLGVIIRRGAHQATVTLADGENVSFLAAGEPLPEGTPSWLASPTGGSLVGAGTIVANGIQDDEGATLASVSLSGYAAGHLDALTAADFADKKGHQVGSISATAIDLDGLDRVFDTGRYTADAETWSDRRVLLGHAEMNRFVNHDSGGDAGGLDRVSVDGLAARPFASSPTSANTKTRAFIQDAAQAVSITSASALGFRARDSAAGNTVTLQDLAIKGYADGALASFAFDGFGLVQANHQKITVGHFDLTGLNVTKVLHAPSDQPFLESMMAAGDGAVRLDSTTLKDVSVTPPSGGTVTLQSLTEVVNNATPVHVTLTLRGLSIPADAVHLKQNPLALMKIDPLILDLDEAWSFNDTTGDATIEQTKLTGRGLGTLSLSGAVTGLPHGPSLPVAGFAAIEGISIARMTLSYSNETLVQRLIAEEARQEAKTPAEVTDTIKLAASIVAAAVVPDQPDAGEQIAAFIESPKTLTLTASPAAPVSVANLVSRTGLAASQKALNLHLSAQ
jgi:hypothetical protein